MNTLAFLPSVPAAVRHGALMILLAAAGVAFGADELKEAPPVVSEPGTADTSSDFAKGWSVVRVAIPSTGNISHAFVDLKSAAGRVLTLSDGVMSKEDVTLEKIEWSGSPVRAKVVLRKGQERAELYADASLVARDDALSRREPLVEIESKFVELPDAVAKRLTLPGSKTVMDKTLGTPPPVEPHGLALVGILNEKDAREWIEALLSQQGVDPLNTPKVTTRSQQRAVVEIIREYRYPTEFKLDQDQPGQPVPTAFETRNHGVTLDVRPSVSEDGVIDLDVTPQVVEFLGQISYPSGETLPVKHDPPRKFADRLRTLMIQPEKPYAPGEIRQPVFSTRKTNTQVSIHSGQTLVFLSTDGGSKIAGFESGGAGKQLLVIVRASVIDSREPQLSRAEQPAARQTPNTDVPPYATPVPNKHGFATSPHAPHAGHIDVRGLSSGTEVKCPYTGKMFRVP